MFVNADLPKQSRIPACCFDELLWNSNSWFNFKDAILSHLNAKNVFQLHIKGLKQNSLSLALSYRTYEISGCSLKTNFYPFPLRFCKRKPNK